ncbi:MAG TPA: zf-HC2 domain-containing protein [Actinomycetes bacterium]|nr:zf-HC2 domain-containing protein [Actinomycetes bacterium]
MPDRPDHPDREQLAAFQAGDGERRQRSEVEAHLAGCPSCAEVVASVARARSGLALLEEPILPAGLHDRVAAAVEAEAAQAAADLPAARRPEASPEVLRPTPWYRRPVAWGAAAALLLAALVVPFLDQSGTMTSADRDAAGTASQEAATEGGGGAAPLPVIRIPGEVTAAKVQATLTVDRRAKTALDAAGGGTPADQAAPPSGSLSREFGQQEAARSSTPAPQAHTALLASCLPAATGDADAATRPLTPAFFVEGTYQGREATILVTTSASPPGRVDLWVFPRNDCSAPPVATERVR